MIIDNTQPRLISCSFVTNGSVKCVRLLPGKNVVDDSDYADMIKHPGFNNKVEAGMLVVDAPKVVAKAKAKSKAKAKVKPEAEVYKEANAEG